MYQGTSRQYNRNSTPRFKEPLGYPFGHFGPQELALYQFPYVYFQGIITKNTLITCFLIIVVNKDPCKFSYNIKTHNHFFAYFLLFSWFVGFSFV